MAHDAVLQIAGLIAAPHPARIFSKDICSEQLRACCHDQKVYFRFWKVALSHMATVAPFTEVRNNIAASVVQCFMTKTASPIKRPATPSAGH